MASDGAHVPESHSEQIQRRWCGGSSGFDLIASGSR